MDLEGLRLLAAYDGSPTFDIYNLEMKIDPRVLVLRMMMMLNDVLGGMF